ncbi:diguanylate cyclase [Gordonia sp. NPDC003376]
MTNRFLSGMTGRFDQRTIGVLSSEMGAIPLIVVGLLAPGFIRPGLHPFLALIGLYTVVCVAITVWAGRLSDRQFIVLSLGGMVGIAVSGALISDPGTGLVVLALLAAIPALAAMSSPRRVVIVFVVVAVGLAVTVAVARAPSWSILIIGGGAVLMAIAAPTYMVTMLRRNLTALLARQEHLSTTDPLTQALNRRGLVDNARSLFRAAAGRRLVALIVVDVDYFKRFNDLYGHSAGDAILVEITEAMRACTPPDALVARSGGEEFAVLTLVDDPDELQQMADAMRVSVAEATSATVSIGAVCARILEIGPSGSALSSSAVLDCLAADADQLLYSAKGMGRNRVETADLPPLLWDRHADDAGPAPGISADTQARKRPVVPPGGRTAPTVSAPGRGAAAGSTQTAAIVEILHPHRDRDRIDHLRGSGAYRFVDTWASAAAELGQLDRLDHVEPGLPRPVSFDVTDPDAVEQHSRYVVFPWRATVARVPDPGTYYRLKTARNRFLITSTEQDRWRDARIAVAGLSVGTAAVVASALTGARHFGIADSDGLSLTNLNRLVGSACDVGMTKVELAARRILELDPYTHIDTFPDGYSPAVADDFLGYPDGRQVSVLIEEIDDVAMKIDLRRRCRAAGIPVVSATDMGDNVILDVERFDLDRSYPIFHGRGEHFSPTDASDPAERLRMATAIVGDVVTRRMAFSASQIGRGLSSWPQLGSTASMAGAMAAAAARNIVCGRPVESGRYQLDVEGLLLSGETTLDGAWNELSTEDLMAMVARLTASPDGAA